MLSFFIQSLPLGELVLLIKFWVYLEFWMWFLANILSFINKIVALLCCFERLIFRYLWYNIIVVFIPLISMIEECNIVTLALGCILLIAQILSKCNQIKTLVNIHWDLDWVQQFYFFPFKSFITLKHEAHHIALLVIMYRLFLGISFWFALATLIFWNAFRN